jgi:Ni/Fe-hydrogenase subunit HybB-like protein
MSEHALVHRPVGGKLLTPGFVALVALGIAGGLVMLYRFVFGLGAVSNLNNGYPWGIWIAIDVVIGTALGCGGYAVGILVYILNRGKYHPLVRPAILTSLLGYGFAGLGVVIDLGRFWEIWKVPVYFWHWSHSPQLEVALCVMTYVAVLAVELSPALLEKMQTSASSGYRRVADVGLRFMDRALVWIVALGLLLPTMHQSSLGTMMLLPGPRVHPLWFTPWLPFLFLVNCIVIGYAIVVIEATFSSLAFHRERHTAMIGSLSKVALWVTLFWIAFRLIDVAIRGTLPFVTGARGVAFVLELLLPATAVGILLSERRRANPAWQIRAAILLLGGGALFRIDSYLVSYMPGANFSYFPSVSEIVLTLGMIALELAFYIAAVRFFPILSGAPAPASTRS